MKGRDVVALDHSGGVTARAPKEQRDEQCGKLPASSSHGGGPPPPHSEASNSTWAWWSRWLTLSGLRVPAVRAGRETRTLTRLAGGRRTKPSATRNQATATMPSRASGFSPAAARKLPDSAGHRGPPKGVAPDTTWATWAALPTAHRANLTGSKPGLRPRAEGDCRHGLSTCANHQHHKPSTRSRPPMVGWGPNCPELGLLDHRLLLSVSHLSET